MSSIAPWSPHLGFITPDRRPLEVDVWACPHPPGLMEGTGPPGDTSPRPPTILAADGARDGICGGLWAAPWALLASFLAPKLGQMTHTWLLSKRGKLVVFYQFAGSESWSRICFVCPVAAHKSLSWNNWIIGKLKMRAWRQGWAAPRFGGFNLTCQVKPDISCASNCLTFSETHMGPVKPRRFPKLNGTSVTYRSNDHCIEGDMLMPTK